MKEGRTPVLLEASRGQNPEYIHHVLNGNIAGDDLFHNHHAIDKGDVKVSTSDVPVESNSESVSDPYTTPIK